MKFIITENKREHLIDNLLSNQYGGLLQFIDKNLYDLIFFFRDVDNQTAEDLVFHYDIDNQSAVIPWDMVDSIRIFTGDEWESKEFVKKWLKKTYGIDPVNLYRKQ